MAAGAEGNESVISHIQVSTVSGIALVMQLDPGGLSTSGAPLLMARVPVVLLLRPPLACDEVGVQKDATTVLP